MAFRAGVIGFTGTLDGISSYYMRGVERPIMRRKGGPRGEKVKNSAGFINTRRNNNEWKGSIAAAKQVRMAMQPVLHLNDYNYTGSLNAICKKIQQADAVKEWGQRTVRLSGNPHHLTGFSLNKFNIFENLLRCPLQIAADRKTAGIQVSLPELLPGTNFFNTAKHPQFQLIFSLGLVPDMLYDNTLGDYIPAKADLPQPVVYTTPWHWAKEKLAAATFTLNLDNQQEYAGTSFLFSAGIAFGMPESQGLIRYIKYSGSAKLLAVF